MEEQWIERNNMELELKYRRGIIWMLVLNIIVGLVNLLMLLKLIL